MSALIKNQLKNAREAIDRKDYTYALELCNQVLENDPNNYNALVFIGLSEQNLNRFQNSEHAYHKAIAINGDQPFAFHGLVNLYEKIPNLDQAIECLHQLRNLYERKQENQKAIEQTDKIFHLIHQKSDRSAKIKHLLLVLSTPYLAQAISSLFKDMPTKNTVWNHLCSLQETIDADFIQREIAVRRNRLGSDPLPILTKKVEQEAISQSRLEEFYQGWLDQLSETPDHQLLQNCQTKMFDFLMKKLTVSSNKEALMMKLKELTESLLADNVINVNLIRFILETTDGEVLSIPEKVFELIDKLGSYDENHLHRLLLLLKELQCAENSLSLNTILEKIPQESADSMIALRLKIILYSRLKDYRSAIDVISLFLVKVTLIESTYQVNLPRLLLSSKLLKAQASISLKSPLLLQNALEMLNELVCQYCGNEQIHYTLSECLFELDRYNESLSNLDSISDYGTIQVMSSFLRGKILFKKGSLEESLGILNDLKVEHSSDELYYYIGLIYWSMGNEFKSSRSYAYSSWMKALQLNKNHSLSFQRLGIFYEEIEQDIHRAIKCFQKAMSLDECDMISAEKLTKLFLQTKDVHNAKNILETVLKIDPRLTWAWERKGLIELEEHHYSEAIISLQSAIRCNSKAKFCLEALGQAYLADGKYTAGLKTFRRCLEHDSDSVATNYFLSVIYMKIGKFHESISLHDRIDSLLHPKIIPAISIQCVGALVYATTDAWNNRDLLRSFEYAEKALMKTEELINLSANSHVIFKLLSLAVVNLLRFRAFRSDQLRVTLDRLSNRLTHLLDIENLHKIIREILDHIYQSGSSSITVDILKVAIMSACKAIILASDMSTQTNMWTFLGCILHQLSHHSSFSRIYVHAAQSLMVSLQLNPSNSEAWHQLALVTRQYNPKFSQHAFISSLELNTKQAIVWFQLGLFYIEHKAWTLAHQSFSQAQTVDPESPFSWFGFGLLKLSKGDADTLDLFEQAHTLSQSYTWSIDMDYCWASNVVEAIMNKEPSTEITKLLLDNSKLDDVLFTLERGTLNICDDYKSNNLGGILQEWLGHFEEASRSYSKALSSSLQNLIDGDDDDIKVAICKNYIRALFSAKKYSECVDVFQDFTSKHPQKIDIWTLIVVGLAHFYQQSYQESFGIFHQALQMSLELSVDVQNNLSVYLSQVLYSIGGDEQIQLAKQQLFIAISKDGCFLPAILSLAALGIVLEDKELMQSAVLELDNMTPDEFSGYEKEVSIVRFFFNLVQGSFNDAKRALLKIIHMRPNDLSHWVMLLDYINKFDNNVSQSDSFLAIIDAIYVQAKSIIAVPSDFEWMKTVSLAQLKFTNGNQSTRSLWKHYLHAQPYKSEAFVVALLALQKMTLENSKTQTRLSKLDRVIQKLKIVSLKTTDEHLKSFLINAF